MGFTSYGTTTLSALTVSGALTASGTTTLGVTTASALAVTGIATLNGGSATAGSAPVLTPTNSNGTAAQLSDLTRDYMVYITVGTGGTVFIVKAGPTSTPANTIVPSSTVTTGQVVSFRLPAGWFWEWSATTATLAGQTAIGC